ITYDTLGLLLSADGKPKEAEAAHRDALALRRQLVNSFPTVSDFQNDLAATLGNLGAIHKRRGEFADGVALLEEALPHHEAALKASPQHPIYRMIFRNNLEKLAQCLMGLGKHAQVATAAEQLARLGYEQPDDTFTAACFISSCVEMSQNDKSLAESK